jgi:hypothetical protein
LNPRPHEAQLEDPKSREKIKKVIQKKENHKSQQTARKVAKPSKMANKSKEKLKINTEAQKSKKSSK